MLIDVKSTNRNKNNTSLNLIQCFLPSIRSSACFGLGRIYNKKVTFCVGRNCLGENMEEPTLFVHPCVLFWKRHDDLLPEGRRYHQPEFCRPEFSMSSRNAVIYAMGRGLQKVVLAQPHITTLAALC